MHLYLMCVDVCDCVCVSECFDDAAVCCLSTHISLIVWYNRSVFFRTVCTLLLALKFLHVCLCVCVGVVTRGFGVQRP